MRVSRPVFICLFALLFALLSLGVRLLVLGTNTDILGDAYLFGILISGFHEYLIGALLAYLLLLTNNNRWLSFGSLAAIVFLVFIKVISFHYESVFHRLPALDILFYLSELEDLSVSVESNLSVTAILVEVLVVSTILILSWLVLQIDSKLRMETDVLCVSMTALAISVSLAIQLAPTMVPNKYYSSSREVVTWLARTGLTSHSYNMKDLTLSEKDMRRFLGFHGNEDPGPAISREYPICRVADNKIEKARKRNIILLILESVGYEEMQADFRGVKLMPNLRRIAENGISFRNIYAAGHKSAQALPAIFSGLSPQPEINYLWTNPLLNFQGFPEILSDNDYETVYLHGGDLTFERQRSYLRDAGFENIFEYDPERDYPAHGWGYDDRIMFEELKDRIERYNSDPQIGNYLISLFTLSTHDPYVLPPDWEPVFSGETRIMNKLVGSNAIEGESNSRLALADAYRFLDDQLGRFYQWYLENSRDSVLVIVGDHVPHLDILDNKQKPYNHRFRVPFVIEGLHVNEEKRIGEYLDREAGLQDVPATIMSLIGMPAHECNLGMNLLVDERRWPGNRFIYSISGEAHERIRIWHQGYSATYDKYRNDYSVNNLPSGVKFNRIVFDKFLETTLKVHHFLLNKNAYAPASVHVFRQAVAGTNQPLLVSHRGNHSGPTGPGMENSRQAIEAAIGAGFEWIELDVRTTKDGTAVLIHDPVVNINGETRKIHEVELDDLVNVPAYQRILTLKEVMEDYADRVNLLIEAKWSDYLPANMHLAREIARFTQNTKSDKRIIVDSFDEYIALSVKQYCDCEVGLDTPFMESVSKDHIEYLVKAGFDWIYLHYSVVDKSLIKNAHEAGLKVMVYTVNDKDVIRKMIGGGLPDGIITDTIEIASLVGKQQIH